MARPLHEDALFVRADAAVRESRRLSEEIQAQLQAARGYAHRLGSVFHELSASNGMRPHAHDDTSMIDADQKDQGPVSIG